LDVPGDPREGQGQGGDALRRHRLPGALARLLGPHGRPGGSARQPAARGALPVPEERGSSARRWTSQVVDDAADRQP
jgi:hypothetical protein